VPVSQFPVKAEAVRTSLHKQFTAHEGLIDVASSGSHVHRAGESMGNQFLEFDMVLQYVTFTVDRIFRQEYGAVML
jgi:hypothetical protein